MQHQRRFVVDPPQRVVLLGSPGSGRAALADLIGARFGLPMIALDYERSLANPPQAEWRKRVQDLAAEPRWIMTGNQIETLSLRASRAEWLIFLNMPLSTCLARLLRAAVSSRAEKRRELDGGLWRSIREAWSFPTGAAPRIMGVIEQERRNRTIFILHSTRDLSGFVAKLPDPDQAGRGDSQTQA